MAVASIEVEMNSNVMGFNACTSERTLTFMNQLFVPPLLGSDSSMRIVI